MLNDLFESVCLIRKKEVELVVFLHTLLVLVCTGDLNVFDSFSCFLDFLQFFLDLAHFFCDLLSGLSVFPFVKLRVLLRVVLDNLNQTISLRLKFFLTF